LPWHVLFNDMLGTTLGSVKNGAFSAIKTTAFGVGSNNAFFTGKPHVEGLGYVFLFRNYKPETGKWMTSDPLGYPDGWNNFAYCNNQATSCVDILGLVKILYWAPGESSGGDKWFGHMSVLLDDGTYMSYWPSEPVDGPFDEVPARPADLANDIDGEDDRMPDVIEVDGLDESSMKSWWDNGDHGDFSGLNNCTDITKQALEAGGMDLSSNLWNDPESLKRDIDDHLLYGDHNLTYKYIWDINNINEITE